MKVIQNPDAEFVHEIRHALKENNGYCPCAVSKTPDTKCRCKEFREQIERGDPGSCHCGLWIAVEEEKNDVD